MPRPAKTSKKRKFHGAGTIHEIESKTKGTRFEAQAYLGLRPDGKQNRLSKTFSSERAAEAWLRDITAPSLKANHIDHRRRRLGEVADAYMDWARDQGATHNLRPNTLVDYERVHVKLKRLPICMVFLQQLTTDDVSAALRAIARGDVGRASVQEANRVLKQLRRVLAFAMRKQWTSVNAASAVSTYKLDQRKRACWEPEEVRKFLIEARTHPQHTVLFEIALSYGCRIGELMALRWKDVQLVKKLLQIEHSYDSKTGVGPPKFGSRRTVLITDRAVELLEAHRRDQEKEKAWAGDAWQEHGLVFPSGVGTYLSSSNVRRVFNRLIGLSGVPRITIHDMRHTAASGMIRSGDDVALIADILGHKDPSITLRVYAHVFAEHKRHRAHDTSTLYGETSMGET